MQNYKTPGVYVDEISIFPPSVAQVETAIPAFIGYTEKGPDEATRITSMVDYVSVFGGPCHELPEFKIDSSGDISTGFDDGNGNFAEESVPDQPVYKMYYMLQLYFANGGGPCYILSAGSYNADSPAVSDSDMTDALPLLKKEDEPTLILFPDAASITDSTKYHDLYKDALGQCAELGDRFLICDVKPGTGTDPIGDAASTFRNNIGTSALMYGAAYYPNLKTTLTHSYSEDAIKVHNDGTEMVLRYSDEAIADDNSLRDTSLYHVNNGADRRKYYDIRKMIEAVKLILPPSAAVAGAYAMVDANRGVWKSPANVSLNRVSKPTEAIEHSEQQDLNVSDTGKSINAIRSFTGKGVLVWGARTLDGNSNEWRYVSVRRFFNMVEESVKKASEAFVFEPNDANTWVKVKAMIENFLTIQWRAGALMGAKPEQAFFVKVGLGETMTQQDVLEGRMIVEIGMAAVRPAEFIILRFSHKMLES